MRRRTPAEPAHRPPTMSAADPNPAFAPEPHDEPDYRFTLANERTFLAWIRTSLALLAGGVAVVQLVPRVGSPASRFFVGELLILLSMLIAASSMRRWNRIQRAMRSDGPLPATSLPLVLAGGLTLIAALGLLLVLNSR